MLVNTTNVITIRAMWVPYNVRARYRSAELHGICQRPDAGIELITTVVVLRAQTRSSGTHRVLARVLQATSTGVPRV